jgi:predicted dehydrogenase
VTLRIGTLGAARITPAALVRPARQIDGVEVVAVAARDRGRADAFSRKHGIGRVHDSYDALVADPEVDAIYNPLPNGLHGRWTIAALEAGKHVLCEKPFTANATEAEEVAAVAERCDRVVMEAFHYRYHPLAERLRAVVADELGAVRTIETSMCFPLPRFADIRYQFDLAGGALMDAGCYAVHLARVLGGEPEVLAATALRRDPDVDRAMAATVRFPSGAEGRITCSMWSRTLLRIGTRVTGEDGEVRVLNPYAPHLFHRFVVRTGGRRQVERFPRRPTYSYQLEAFRDAVVEGAPILTGTDDAIANMRVIDAIYRAAGMRPRGT